MPSQKETPGDGGRIRRSDRMAQASTSSQKLNLQLNGGTEFGNVYAAPIKGHEHSMVLVVKKFVESELQILERMKESDCVVNLLASIQNSTENWMAMLQERLYPVNAVFDAIQYDDVGKVGQGCGFILDGLKALRYLEEMQVIHRDISPSNIMYSYGWRRWKLIDFGLAVNADDVPCNFSGNCVGTRDYIAPELLGQHGTYSTETDYYSFGRCVEDYVSVPLTMEMVMSGSSLTRACGRLNYITDLILKRVPKDQTQSHTLSLLTDLIKLNDSAAIKGVNDEYIGQAMGRHQSDLVAKYGQKTQKTQVLTALGSDENAAHVLNLAIQADLM